MQILGHPGSLRAIPVICISYNLYPQHNGTPRESIQRRRGDGFQEFWGGGWRGTAGEDPVSTDVTCGGESDDRTIN